MTDRSVFLQFVSLCVGFYVSGRIAANIKVDRSQWLPGGCFQVDRSILIVNLHFNSREHYCHPSPLLSPRESQYLVGFVLRRDLLLAIDNARARLDSLPGAR